MLPSLPHSGQRNWPGFWFPQKFLEGLAQRPAERKSQEKHCDVEQVSSRAVWTAAQALICGRGGARLGAEGAGTPLPQPWGSGAGPASDHSDEVPVPVSRPQCSHLRGGGWQHGLGGQPPPPRGPRGWGSFRPLQALVAAGLGSPQARTPWPCPQLPLPPWSWSPLAGAVHSLSICLSTLTGTDRRKTNWRARG